MRLPDAAHTSRPWRIHELTPDFRIEDVWALPTPGGPGDFPDWCGSSPPETIRATTPAPPARSGRSDGSSGSCSAGTVRTPASVPGRPRRTPISAP
jgi:hypothetical protein